MNNKLRKIFNGKRLWKKLDALFEKFGHINKKKILKIHINKK